jgi:hypothetical protein
MGQKRVFITGRVTGVPTGEFDAASGVGEMFLVSVDDDGTSRLWGAFLVAGDKLVGRLADGDMVAVVGREDVSRREEKIRGPLLVEALLAMNYDGDFFGGFGQ